jgi:hypothetical protein
VLSSVSINSNSQAVTARGKSTSSASWRTLGTFETFGTKEFPENHRIHHLAADVFGVWWQHLWHRESSQLPVSVGPS